MRDALDEPVQPQPPEVVGDLPAGHEIGSLPEQGRQVAAQVGVGEAVGQQAEDAQDVQEGERTLVGQAQPGHAGAGRGGDRVGDLGQGVGSGDGVMAEYLGAQQAPVGGEADLPQCGQVGQPFPDPEVAGLVDGRFRSDRLAQLVVLLYFRVLVVDVQAGGDALGDDPGAEPAWGGVRSLADDAAAEDQADLVRAADGQVVMDDLVEEDPPGDRLVQHLGEGELRLQHGDVIPVPGGLVRGRVRVRQDRQPLAGQRLDLVLGQRVTDRLQPGDVIAGGEPVIQRGEADPGPGGPGLGIVMPVDQQLGPIGEIRGELEEERPEVLIHAVHVELVHHRGRPHDPRIGPAVRSTALFGPEHGVLLLRPADEQHPLGPPGRLERGQVLLHHVVLALAPGKVDAGNAVHLGEGIQPRDEVPAHRGDHRGRRDRLAQMAMDERQQPLHPLQLRNVQVAVHPVNRFDLEQHMTGHDIGHTAR